MYLKQVLRLAFCSSVSFGRTVCGAAGKAKDWGVTRQSPGCRSPCLPCPPCRVLAATWSRRRPAGASHAPAAPAGRPRWLFSRGAAAAAAPPEVSALGAAAAHLGGLGKLPGLQPWQLGRLLSHPRGSANLRDLQAAWRPVLPLAAEPSATTRRKCCRKAREGGKPLHEAGVTFGCRAPSLKGESRATKALQVRPVDCPACPSPPARPGTRQRPHPSPATDAGPCRPSAAAGMGGLAARSGAGRAVPAAAAAVPSGGGGRGGARAACLSDCCVAQPAGTCLGLADCRL